MNITQCYGITNYHNNNTSFQSKRARNTLAAGLMTLIGLTSTSCTRGPLTKMAEKSVAPEVVERVDSIAQMSKKILNSGQYTKYGTDTIKLTMDFYENPNEYIKYLNSLAKDNVPKVKTGTKTSFQPQHVGKSVIMVPMTIPVYSPQYLDSKTLVIANEFYTTKCRDIYIPVEYYGKQNPNIKGK